ncbi:MAG TPA: hypothetical protein VGL94_08310, partial [Ktedonobacteraceae bacterium]
SLQYIRRGISIASIAYTTLDIKVSNEIHLFFTKTVVLGKNVILSSGIAFDDILPIRLASPPFVLQDRA